MPNAPLSSSRVASSIAPAQTRTTGVTPAGNAAMQSCVASCMVKAPCSMSMNMMSCPVEAAINGAATLRR